MHMHIAKYMYMLLISDFFQTKHLLKDRGSSVSLSNIVTVEKRLLAIPILYIFLRMWGTIQFCYSLIVSSANVGGCIPHAVLVGYQVFGYLQVYYNSIILDVYNNNNI